ncbi:cytochrome c oxidase subunit 3 [Pseudobacteriovorax antillogorgiicola]|uniref:Cytochrome bo(3) ubiquinol oxidase subunit 3 n=1 Tax=Pseudobacteriovorax antillogorgiicola TaxID=1513793 RepID=A0A1Y6BTS2_9BACT|nr:cytochrome c oxidase subunit 3 [Pseudobacteriovorax antillogorgiicola]TCS53895.1 cytochrome c oxidase subunit 3/cytochrome o ubiquinol oxidase subunit 3 [Pseudobacteriovorax antillogorgiicola]SMF20856.1 cytochrome c oxidase subunit 3/cytochrome o ubiquinol oxidase subunit 3 [Pseudobacteriovorax antillogorgiicola]
MSAHIETNTGVDNRKFAMWTLIASECFLFGTLIVNYFINRERGLAGPTGPEIFDINLTTLSTFDLLMSSVAMVLALHHCRARNLKWMQFWLFIVALGGAIFLGFQYYEFDHFVNAGLKLDTSVFGSAFYMLTGCHGLHVAVGVLWITSILITSLKRGESWFDSDTIEVAGLYWHFVDVVWIIIFTVVYLFVYV